MFVYVGTYTAPDGNASGIEIYRFDEATGSLTHLGTKIGVANPSFLALHPDQQHLYAGERYLYTVGEGQQGEITAYSRDSSTGELTLINQQPSGGLGPCYVSVDASGKYVLVANYTSGSVAALPIQDGGGVGEATSIVQHTGSSVYVGRQGEPHAHMIAPSPDGKAILAADLGTDEVVIYTLEGGVLDRAGAIAVDAGSGPRHFAFSPDGSSLYVLNELNSSLIAYDYDAERLAFPHRQTVSTLPDGFHGENWPAQIVVSPDSKFVYASNRGHDSIAIFAVGEDGVLTQVAVTSTGGTEPRNFNITPSGDWLLAANQNSDTIVVFRRDAETGMLHQHGEPVPSATPVCIVFAAE
ncbi:MAG: lactonase family protein [Thermomicrobiales bacterium]|jgi:6-phosphogluconolactonase|nr:lactonase family protein [Thermomicrobiales bacterium]